MEMSRPGRQFQEFNSRSQTSSSKNRQYHQTDVRPRRRAQPKRRTTGPQAQWPL